eukprot:NODE_113_length_18482_cov_1.630746.p5 type:complete len:448 gc:universal NODE_113_length_18482_cov_1.630746:9057-7714(-)
MSESSSVFSKEAECIHTKIVPSDGTTNLKCQLCSNTLFPIFLKEYHQLQNSNHSLSEKNHYLNNKLSQAKDTNAQQSQQLKDLTTKYNQLQGLESSRNIEYELKIQELMIELDKYKKELKEEQDKSLFYMEEKNAINTELQELSRALFEEANGMVAEENKKNFYLEQDNRNQKVKISQLQDELYNERLQLKELKTKMYAVKETQKSSVKWIDKIDDKQIESFEVFTLDLKDLLSNYDDDLSSALPNLITLVNTHQFMQPIIQEMQLLLKGKINTGVLIENTLRDAYKLDYFAVDPNISRIVTANPPKSPTKLSRPSKCGICDNDLYFHPYFTLTIVTTTILSKTTNSHHLCIYCKDRVSSICDLIVFIKHISQNLYKKSPNMLYVDLIKYRLEMLVSKIGCQKLSILLKETIDGNQTLDASASSLDITMSNVLKGDKKDDNSSANRT